jgi:hypothetical protein
MLYAILIVVVICFLALLGAMIWLWSKNPTGLIAWWNQRIGSECDLQDGVNPLYQNAWTGPNPVATQFHHLIHLNHDNILIEVQAARQELGSTFDIGNPWVKDETPWHPMWVRFMGEWAPTSHQLPTLRKIASLFPDVITLHISIFEPGSTVIEHKGSSRAIHRYHYGLKIPAHDRGLKIGGQEFQWQEGEGFICDDTLPHSAWNHTNEPRIVILADIFRPLSRINRIGSRAIYTLLQQTSTPQLVDQEVKRPSRILTSQ